MRNRPRRILACVLTLGLCLISSAPLWHGDHLPANPVDPSSSIHKLCHNHVHRASPRTLNPVDNCPICLSHRLLAQGWARAVAGAAAPTPDPSDVLPPRDLVADPCPLGVEARGPPLC